MKIYIGSDHAGFELKKSLVGHLKEKGIQTADMGARSAEASDDYPDYAKAVAEAVSKEPEARGVLVCGTGIGMAMTANKVSGIRAAVVHDEYTAEVSRSHNDSNVLCMGGRVLEAQTAERLLDIWLATPFEGGRHARRVEKIKKLDCAQAQE